MAIAAKKDAAPAAALMAATPLGLKRICARCSAVYYDGHRRPAVCPSCGAEYVVPTGGRATAARALPPDDEVDEVKVAVADDPDIEDAHEDLPEADAASDDEADILPDDGDDDGDDGDLGIGITIQDEDTERP